VTTKVAVAKTAVDATAIKTNQLDAQTQKLLHDKELYVN
jgi:hypothetical protein